MKDNLGLKESVQVKKTTPSLTSIKERLNWKAKWTIRRFKDDAALRADKPYSISEFEGNVALNEGIQVLIELGCGIGANTAWDNTNARLGVGNGTAAEDAAQTGLQGATKTFKAMDATYPQRSNQDAIWRSTYGSGEGNHAWEEFTVVNAADDTGDNLNRKVSAQGTKTSGQSWELTLTITFS